MEICSRWNKLLYPNYGYLLVIDSNFADVSNTQVQVAEDENKPQQQKIISTIFGNVNSDLEYPNPTPANIETMVYQDFKNVFNPNNFSLEKIQNGLIKPSPIVMDLISNIYLDSFDKYIEKYILKYMRQFLNNRIGTFLNNSEIEDIVKINRPSFKRGEMVILRVAYNTYKWCVFLEQDTSRPGINNRFKILSKNNPDDTEVIEMTVPFGNLNKYRDLKSVTQKYDSQKAI